MTANTCTKSTLGILLLVGMTIQPAATASQRPYHDSDIDIKSLKPRYVSSQDSHRINIRYRVRIKDTAPEGFDAVFTFFRKDQRVTNAKGQAVKITKKLENPRHVRDDRWEFKKNISVVLTRDAMFSCKNVKMLMHVVDRETGRIVDSKRKSLKKE
ncbi:MAG: hypothetical protein ACYTHJ_05685 [Planctomycetota bacterium]